MSREIKIDCLIVGGGIAGLWCQSALREKGYSTLLLSKGPLGAGQTIASQGIIHGGTKYTLNQTKTAAADALAEMPGRWRQALEGRDPVDLSRVTVAADNHLL